MKLKNIKIFSLILLSLIALNTNAQKVTSFFEKGKYDKAEAYCEKQSGDEQKQAYTELADLYFGIGDLENADKFYSKSQNPQEGYLKIANVYFEQENMYKAETFFEKANKNEEGHLKIANYYFAKNDLLKAEEHYAKTNNPEEYFFNIAEKKITEKNYEKAEKLYAKSNNPNAGYLKIANSYFQENKLEIAGEYFGKTDNPKEGYLKIANEYQKNGNIAKANEYKRLSQEIVVFEDNFDNNNSNWNIGNNKIQNGEFCIETEIVRQDANFLKEVNIDWDKQWTFEAKFTFKERSNGGKNKNNASLIFGYSDDKNYLVYNIKYHDRNDRYMSIAVNLLYQGSTKDMGLGSSGKLFSDDMYSENNEYILKVFHKNAALYFYLNGIKIFECNDPALNEFGRNFGFAVGNYTNVCIDYIKLKQNNELGFVKPKQVTTMNGLRWGIVNEKGEKLTPAKYKIAYGFVNNFAIVANDDNLLGFVDTTGKEITPQKYVGVEKFVNGFAQVSIYDYSARNNKRKMYLHGYIDESGKEITPLIYGLASKNFSKNGFAIVSYDNYNSAGNVIETFFGVIDKNGKYIISPDLKYTNITELTNSFFLAKKNSRYDLFNSKGEKLTPDTHTEIIMTSVSPILFTIRDYKNTNDGLRNYYGIIDDQGNWVIKPNFMKITGFEFNNNTLAKVFFNNSLFFYIDKDCNCIEFEGVECPEE